MNGNFWIFISLNFTDSYRRNSQIINDHLFQTSLLPSGLKVSSLDSDASAVSTIGVLVKSGSSFETYDNLGVSHALRLSAGCVTTKNATSFGIVRSIQQVGGHVNVIGSREHLLYLMTAPR